MDNKTSKTSNIYCGKNLNTIITRSLSDCVFIVSDTNVAKLYPDLCEYDYVISAGERFKNADTLNKILLKMSEKGVKRGDVIAAVGGGVVGDLTGLAASLYMRGVDWINVPTTLLAMVDSSIGGKTAIDFNGIKNLIGAFHKPTEIYINAWFAKTLNEREWLCGMGELIKTCLLSDKAYDMLKENFNGLKVGEVDIVYPLIEECVRLKNLITTVDPTENGLRKILNIGHTVGHAIESLDGYKLSHGEYVIKGMMTEIAMVRELVDNDFASELISVLKSLTASPLSTAKAVCEKAKLDKKNGKDDRITIVVPTAVGKTLEVTMSQNEFISRYEKAVRELRKNA